MRTVPKKPHVDPAASEYFKPAMARRLRQLEAEPLDNDAPEDEQALMDWLNRE